MMGKVIKRVKTSARVPLSDALARILGDCAKAACAGSLALPRFLACLLAASTPSSLRSSSLRSPPGPSPVSRPPPSIRLLDSPRPSHRNEKAACALPRARSAARRLEPAEKENRKYLQTLAEFTTNSRHLQQIVGIRRKHYLQTLVNIRNHIRRSIKSHNSDCTSPRTCSSKVCANACVHMRARARAPTCPCVRQCVRPCVRQCVR
eukprot:408416-Pleurochrysis_carterae.AAC.3